MPTMNFVDGAVAGNGAAPRFHADNLQCGPQPPTSTRIISGRRVVLGVRAEHIDVVDAGTSDALPATVPKP